MKRTIIILAILSVLAVCGGAAYSQEYVSTPVTVTKDKVRNSDGKVYYSHVVLEKQTLFSICKAYGVTAEEIYSANPALNIKEEGLKKNSIILIPVVSSLKTGEGNSGETDEPASDDDRQKKKDKSSSDERQGKPAADQSLSTATHVVKWYEDIDAIASKYGVSVDAIMKFNHLSTRKLSTRQKLLIPPAGYSGNEDSAAKEVRNAGEEKSETGNEITEGKVTSRDNQNQEESTGFFNIFKLGQPKTVNMVLMLPFGSQGSPNNNFFDFYSGVLMAAKEMGDAGISTDLSVYDVAGGAFPITVERLRQTDVVIGPVSVTDVTKVLEMSPVSTAVVSPLDRKVTPLVASHKNLIQAPTFTDDHYRDIASWVESDMVRGDKVIVISEKNSRSVSPALTSELSSLSVQYSPLSYSILEGRNIVNTLTSMATATGTNRVIINSESEAFVNDVVRNLNLLVHKNIAVVLYSTSKLRSFDTIDADDLHSLNLHMSTGYHIDYDLPEVKEFIFKYRALFNGEPSQFSFQGYDIAKFFIKASDRYGNQWQDKLAKDSDRMLQTDFSFKEIGSGGYVNKAVRRIVYAPDFTVRIVN